MLMAGPPACPSRAPATVLPPPLSGVRQHLPPGAPGPRGAWDGLCPTERSRDACQCLSPSTACHSRCCPRDRGGLTLLTWDLLHRPWGFRHVRQVMSSRAPCAKEEEGSLCGSSEPSLGASPAVGRRGEAYKVDFR